MKREFSKLGTEASIKNTLPSVNYINENKQSVVPYRSRSGQIEILPQEEYNFEVSSSGKAIYYMKQERENLKTVGLYEDKEPTPPQQNTLTFRSPDDNAKITFTYYNEGVPVSTEIHNNQTVDADSILHPEDGNISMVMISTILPTSSIKVLFSGKYGENDYDKYQIVFDGIVIYTPTGSPTGWNVNLFEGNCVIEVVEN